MAVTIKTDHKWKKFKYGFEVPHKVMREQFSHLDGEEMDGFILYKNHWYHTSDFMRMSNHSDPVMGSYDGYAADSYFSGVLIKISKDGEEYQIASYCS